MTQKKSDVIKGKWYYHEMIVCSIIVLGLFGLGIGLYELGFSAQTSALIITVILGAFICLPLIAPISDIYRWLQQRRKLRDAG